MKRSFLFLPFFLLLPLLFSFSPGTPADQVIGFWLTSDGKAKIQVYKAGDKYFGKIVAGKDLYEANGQDLKRDVKNSSPSKRDRTIKDMVILNNFQYKDGVWSEGTIYDPTNGSTYSCKIKLTGNKLEIRGYVGISLFGRTEIWHRSAE
jgi:uncharacterized protein (DUF2147 family)